MGCDLGRAALSHKGRIRPRLSRMPLMRSPSGPATILLASALLLGSSEALVAATGLPPQANEQRLVGKARAMDSARPRGRI